MTKWKLATAGCIAKGCLVCGWMSLVAPNVADSISKCPWCEADKENIVVTTIPPGHLIKEHILQFVTSIATLTSSQPELDDDGDIDLDHELDKHYRFF